MWLCAVMFSPSVLAKAQMLVFPFASESAYTNFWVLENSYQNHTGVDYACPEGTPVYASFSGTVVEAYDGQVKKICSGWGNTIVIAHGDFTIRYAHLLFDSIPYTVGDTVEVGAFVGYTSNTGKTTNTKLECLPGNGYHLHYEIRHKGKFENPYTYLDGMFFKDPDSSFHFPSEGAPSYYYDDNITSCLGPVTGGESTDWWYTCANPTATIKQGDTAWVMLNLEDAMVNHAYKVVAYRNGVYQWEWSPGWNTVGEWGWNTSFFWASWSNVPPGNLKLEVHLDTDYGFQLLNSVMVTAKLTTPYLYDDNGHTCQGPVTGGASTNWWYTCQWPTTFFASGQTVWGLFRLDDVYVDHGFKVEAYHEGVLRWQWSPGWNIVGARWNTSFFWFRLFTAPVGKWEFKIFVDIGNGYTPLDTLVVTVI
ncbi:MAG TPA: hypothetical protein DCY48_03020 [Candidatus Magasanikbacteria bacterium]|nr:MAG: hypothetical protein A3I74_05230 [Candidatus Magasanikbacteria bacterium RIFCSPLOWO2_02_FULL_47_16]OGH83109.1 MAG: hypothetical protein A3G08_01775 [Candidatus Magasanikbacteria bacterium RIFCSPLOWO2_12_FULL_47_9b]HAZ28721.1 hypothetical protein [Candidatus Magasanikbacteria bacterium]